MGEAETDTIYWQIREVTSHPYHCTTSQVGHKDRLICAWAPALRRVGREASSCQFFLWGVEVNLTDDLTWLFIKPPKSSLNARMLVKQAESPATSQARPSPFTLAALLVVIRGKLKLLYLLPFPPQPPLCFLTSSVSTWVMIGSWCLKGASGVYICFSEFRYGYQLFNKFWAYRMHSQSQTGSQAPCLISSMTGWADVAWSVVRHLNVICVWSSYLFNKKESFSLWKSGVAEQFWAPTLQMYTHAPAEFTARSVWALKAAGQGSFSFVFTVQAETLFQLSNSWDTSVALQVTNFQGFLSHYLLWHLDFSYVYKIHEGKSKIPLFSLSSLCWKAMLPRSAALSSAFTAGRRWSSFCQSLL